MFGIELSVQMYIFIKSVGVGFFIGFVYNLFMLFRISFLKNSLVVFFQDVSFFIFAAIFTFLFVLETNFGLLRFYIFAGELIGFCLYYFLPAQAINFLWHKTDKLIKKIFRSIFGFILKPLRLIKRKFMKGNKLKKFKNNKKNQKKLFIFC